jgi:hypothetical protein
MSELHPFAVLDLEPRAVENEAGPLLLVKEVLALRGKIAEAKDSCLSASKLVLVVVIGGIGADRIAAVLAVLTDAFAAATKGSAIACSLVIHNPDSFYHVLTP